MAFELRELIEEEDAMMRQRHLPRHGHLAPTDHADVGDGVVRGAKRLGGDNDSAADGAADDAVDRGAASLKVVNETSERAAGSFRRGAAGAFINRIATQFRTVHLRSQKAAVA